MFAKKHTPLLAVENGVVTRTDVGGLGGISITLRGDSGNSYYYAHNTMNQVSPGQRVALGQQIGTVGDTGNARGTGDHLHFELHPGGGAAVNPTPFVSALC